MKAKFQRFTTAGLMVIFTAPLGLVPLAHATVREWDGDVPMDSNWTTTDNWVGDAAPARRGR